ncbi:unnamed protein product (macronuclear) [Paramecium tetraurelia]|uniref:Uncharacterized protein n=1 Tax=Paramecium tetraurelia TaxID=5888 RepID=A0E3E6_PARTE|nr:uncharacterized protein GSPATT00022986001 [Paramecium tetraurelia]CAK89813.1 unnamed protein product [Paramecium tetraurelia]|eukprot:XP_001457210.1 hypothetical protein (macronuclear) [Paramecium tetraurelia strain d4-2]
MQEIDLLRLHRETLKYLEIESIFKRLTQTFINKIYNLIRDIFAEEHKFTIQELLKMANQKEIPLKEFKLVEHYKLNSQIFKTNLQTICSIVIDDLQNTFNKQIIIEERSILEPKLLTQIDEESQICFTENYNEISQEYSKTHRDDIKTEEAPLVNQESKQVQKVPLAKLLSFDKITSLSVANSPRHSRENSLTTHTFRQSNKPIQQLMLNSNNGSKKQTVTQLAKNKSLELKSIAETLIAQSKISPKGNQTIIFNNLMSKMNNLKENTLKP